MRYNILFLVTISLVSACSYSNISNIKMKKYDSQGQMPSEINKVISTEEISCTVLYNANLVWVIEQHCSTDNKQGIYIIDSTGITKYNWYDKPFSDWAWNEGCNTEDDCYYIATVNNEGKLTGFKYIFYINLSEGFYEVAIRDSSLKVVDKSIIDHPS